MTCRSLARPRRPGKATSAVAPTPHQEGVRGCPPEPGWQQSARLLPGSQGTQSIWESGWGGWAAQLSIYISLCLFLREATGPPVWDPWMGRGAWEQATVSWETGLPPPLPTFLLDLKASSCCGVRSRPWGPPPFVHQSHTTHTKPSAGVGGLWA